MICLNRIVLPLPLIILGLTGCGFTSASSQSGFPNPSSSSIKVSVNPSSITVAAGSTAIKAAEAEAFEEAGVRGVIEGGTPLGSYTYLKRHASGDMKPAVVEVYLLRTTRQAKKWREKAQRTVAWVSIEQAIARHGEPGLAPLLDRLVEIEPMLVRGDESMSRVRFGS